MINSLTFVLLLSVFLTGCASRVLQHERSAEILKTEEYDSKVDIQPAPPPLQKVTELPPVSAVVSQAKKKKPTRSREGHAMKPVEARQPELEDREGFEGRRPIKDPFRQGEKATFELSYFNIVAGTMDVEVKPMVQVNGEKAYHFEVTARSNSFFNRIYAVDDKAVTYLSYERMVPLSLQITIKESKQLAETRTYFDWKNLKASYWQKRITKENGEKSKKLDWDLDPFSQNVITAAYYLRIFTPTVGKKLAFRVADEGKNMVFKGEVLRKEKLKTAIGEFDTVVIRPEIGVDGVFKPVGDITMWLTNDDRKFIVRLESKLKIGSIVAKIKSLEKGLE